MRLAPAWQGTLSDDLVASRVFAGEDARRVRAGLHVAFALGIEPAADAEFLRRQYVIARVTRSHVVHRSWFNRGDDGDVLGEPGSDVCTAIDACRLDLDAGPVLPCLVWGERVRGYLGGPRPRFISRSLCRFDGAIFVDAWCVPLTALVNAAMMLASAAGTHITWRGNTYRIFQGGRIRLLDKPPKLELPHGVRIDQAQQVLDIFHAQPREQLKKFL